VVLKHLQAEVIPPSRRKSDLPMAREIDAVVLRMLAKHPGERFSDAYHLADELRQLIEQLSGGRSSRPPRRSGSMPIQPPLSTATQPWLDAAEESWATRFDVFNSLLGRGFPNGVPESTRATLTEMGTLIRRARELRRELGDNVLHAKQQEDQLRASRLRIGHAADELGRDESRVARRIAEARTALEQAQANQEEVSAPIEAGLKELYATPIARGMLTHRMAELLRRLGGQASFWLEAETQLGPLAGRVASAEREREDLRFQIAQLKGRLGILNVDVEATLGGLRGQADRLESELSSALEALAAQAEAVAQALGAVPGLRELLPTTRLSEPAPRESLRRG
jgi:predicted  nucleic acid-binding Zn-ribbon protein